MRSTIDGTHDPDRRSWVESANSPDTDFPIQNLPFGVFRRQAFPDEAPRIGVAIGDFIVDLRECLAAGLCDALPGDVESALAQPTLNGLLSLGRNAATTVRRELSRLLSADANGRNVGMLVKIAESDLLLPMAVGNYSDFYASIHHATNVGRLFRPDNPLLPNYRHVPIAYHGRASSVVVSGTRISRPSGQVKTARDVPAFTPTGALDYELEAGLVIGPGNALGEPIPLAHAEEHLWGVCLLNDWSARDIQAWEYQPLGPFLAKSFATTVSPWIVTLDALAPFRSAAYQRAETDPQPLGYLTDPDDRIAGGIDLRLEAWIASSRMRAGGMPPMRLSSSSLRNIYWTAGQMVAHHTSNGCNLLPGDLLGSGTVSGPEAGGCLLEITEGGKRAIELPTGEARTYLEDGDEIVLRGYCERGGFRRIGFGACAGVIVQGER